MCLDVEMTQIDIPALLMRFHSPRDDNRVVWVTWGQLAGVGYGGPRVLHLSRGYPERNVLAMFDPSLLGFKFNLI